jgi:uncharacterized protein GlcG (DUF336 family)
MKQKFTLELADIKNIAAAAEAEALKNNWAVTIAIVDETKVYEDVINGGRTSFLSAPDVKGMLEGGVPIMKDGQCLGAVGVSGVKSTEDAQVAKAGIAAIGL